MIFGIGIDIIEVKRVEEKITRNAGFQQKVFSQSEIDYCESMTAFKFQSYAARFAAKEAFLKATGKGLQLSNELNQIIISVDEAGKPSLFIPDAIKRSLNISAFQIHVSLSHLETTACAVVVIETL